VSTLPRLSVYLVFHDVALTDCAARCLAFLRGVPPSSRCRIPTCRCCCNRGVGGRPYHRFLWRWCARLHCGAVFLVPLSLASVFGREQGRNGRKAGGGIVFSRSAGVDGKGLHVLQYNAQTSRVGNHDCSRAGVIQISRRHRCGANIRTFNPRKQSVEPSKPS